MTLEDKNISYVGIFFLLCALIALVLSILFISNPESGYPLWLSWATTYFCGWASGVSTITILVRFL